MIAPDHATKRCKTILRERGIHTWHSDEVSAKANDKLRYLRLAVDHQREALQAVLRRSETKLRAAACQPDLEETRPT
jgi:transposase-like protein